MDHRPAISRTEARARNLLAQLPSQRIDLRTGTLVWGIEDHRLALHSALGTEWLTAQTIIVATGARELVTPFPGWTLPGVMTLGAAQILAKEHGVLPGKRILLAGSGPLLLAAASALSKVASEADILGILEATHPLTWINHASALWGNLDRLREGWHYAESLIRNKIPYRFGYVVVRAEGKDRLTGVILSRIDRQGNLIPNSEQAMAVDALCTGFGFVPNTELTQLAGCEHEFLPEQGGWVPKIDESFQTSVPSMYAIGETAGVGGVHAAMLQGQIAGMAAARELGKLDKDGFTRSFRSIKRQLGPLNRFRAMFNTLFRPLPDFETLSTDEAIVCRCGQVRAGEIRWAIRQGAYTLSDLKNWLPVGQGPCQGRTCGPLLTRLIHFETGRSASEIGAFRPRPPLKPVPLGALAGSPDEDN
jgi:NAD(P)H-nitrite reductase large subunit